MKNALLKLRNLLKTMPESRLMFILAIVVGVLVAFAGHILKWAIHAVQGVANSLSSITSVNWLYLFFPAIGIGLTVLFVKYVVKDEISHGITRIFYAISRKRSKIKLHNTYTSVISSATTIGFGGSVGAEAPIVLTGAAIGSNIGQALKLRYNLITLLLGCGAAAAIAAVFKAPIAGFAFVLEVLMLELTFTSTVPLLIAAVSAATTTYLLVGIEPFFGHYTPHFNLDNVLYYAGLGLLGGILSYLFSSTSTWLEKHIKRHKNSLHRVLLGGGALGLIIFIFPPLYGEGYSTISELLSEDTSKIFDHSLFYGISDNFLTLILYAVGVLFFKIIAMTLTNASGGVGGTFAPSLFFGAMTGFIFSISCNEFLGADLSVGNFTLVGMASVMSGVMKAPITSMFLVAELTGGFELFLPLMLASAVSFAMSYYFEPYSIYTKRLAQKGELLTHNKDENTLQFVNIDKLIEYNFVSVDYDGKLHDMVTAVSKSKRNIFPVLSKGKLMGVITLDNIREVMFKPSLWDAKLLRDYMIDPYDIIISGEDARTAMTKFENSKAWNLPVVDEKGIYIGFISKSSVLTEYRQQLQKLTTD